MCKNKSSFMIKS